MKSNKKILVFVGTRPEAIKMFPLIDLLSRHYNLILCLTGQHKELLDQVVKLFNLKVKYDLKIMRANQTLSNISQTILKKIDHVIIREMPDLVLIHGDTTTAFISALSSFYNKIKIGHVESGLRTNKIYSPFPEEANRQFIARIADLNFSPTDLSKRNLIKENIPKEKIFVVGNTAIDALFLAKKIIKNNFSKSDFIKRMPFLKFCENKKILLVTGHRRENFGEGFRNICDALIDIAKISKEVLIIFSVHLNPKVNTYVRNKLQNINNIFTINPVNYIDFVKLMDLSYIILTDSGGVQEEAPSLGKPVLVLREFTERPEAVKCKTVKIVGTSKAKIFDYTKKLLTNDKYYDTVSKKHNPYGDGNSSLKIKKIIDDNI